ncbi:hypothetical protein Glove_213g60 [Diversispora epigaea]|uniref:Uncharacterized protein n=1 Tax=Diversispora epigaea TaxID=1348612 RepID=A0A397IQS5_9GLOM|nr:hypothetical protein Glove_213g60 [Diversispora epigaea]
MTENKLPLYNEIPISHIQHDFFDESDNKTIRSDSEINENNNLETVFTFNNDNCNFFNTLVDKEGSSSEVNVMTENKLPLYNEIPISHIQHDFFDESDNKTIRSDSEINENNNLETVFTFNNESLHACKLAGEKEEITDDELLLLESFSDTDNELLESFSDNLDFSVSVVSDDPLSIKQNKTTLKLTKQYCSLSFI